MKTAREQQLADALIVAQKVILQMGVYIRQLDENDQVIEYWNQDGDYIAIPEWDQITTAIDGEVSGSVPIDTLKARALELVDGDANPEYNRAICELLAIVDGVEDQDTGDRALDIGHELGLSNEALMKFY